MRFPTPSSAALWLVVLLAAPAGAYESFRVAVYCRAYEVKEMADPAWLTARWEELSRQVHVDKIYLETHRDLLIVDDATLEAAKAFFAARQVETAGGITYTIDESNRFETFSYADPAHRRKVQEIIEHTARHFDEIILDDFFFTSAKSPHDVAAKGDRSWTEYRLALMTEAAENLILRPARAVNPDVRVIIKYPNWYDHFAALGFDLESGPRLFDGLYTGTETRDAVLSAQHLQPYHGYSIMRYFHNLAPGRNGGGWVDTGGARFYDRYAEQLWLTLLAKCAPEITLFDLRQMHYPLDRRHRGPWQDQATSFDFEALPAAPGGGAAAGTYASVAGVALAAVEPLLGQLGQPLGLKSYKPTHSTGEDFLPSFLGMVGLPMEIVPEFPVDAPVVLLTEQAAADPAIVDKLTQHLTRGHSVVITSGLLRALQTRGLHHVAEIATTGRVAQVRHYQAGRGGLIEGREPILIPQIAYRTNDSWELVSAIDGDNGWPLLHDADYLDGQFQVLTIPENFADLYELPAPVLNAIRRVVTRHLPVRLEAPAKVSLFVYDNGTFVVTNFRDEPAEVAATFALERTELVDLLSGAVIPARVREESPGWGKPAVPVMKAAGFTVPPHSFRGFRLK